METAMNNAGSTEVSFLGCLYLFQDQPEMYFVYHKKLMIHERGTQTTSSKIMHFPRVERGGMLAYFLIVDKMNKKLG